MLRGGALTSLLLGGAFALAAGCGSSSKSGDAGHLTSTDHPSTGGSAAEGGTGGSATGGSVQVTGGSGGGISVTGGSAGDGSAGASDECPGENVAANLVPLDLYVMLDSSGSMGEDSGDAGGATKWDAVTSALTAFLGDPQSAGIGIGLQFFPLTDPAAPDSCNSNGECGDFGSCLQGFCQQAGPDVIFCGENSDCVDLTGQDFGPCAPLRLCWSLLLSSADGIPTLCHDDSDCGGQRGDCVEFNQCSGDATYACKTAGTACQATGGQNLGTCEQVAPTSICSDTADCHASAYAAPAAEIASLPGAAKALESAIASKMPDGQTPSAPALQGAIDHAAAWAKAHPDHTVAVLLVTDGLPSECSAHVTAQDPYDIAGVAAIASQGLAADPSIQTFVIGVFAPSDTDAHANLDRIAKAGGSDSAYIVNTTTASGNSSTGPDVEQQFLADLEAIRGARLPCEFQVPKPSSGAFDPKQVNVYFSSGGDSQPLYYFSDPKDCDPKTGGWYYDDPSAPTKIIACPASCDEFQAASQGGKVTIKLKCPTLVK